jgi:hypothetical protein
MRTDRIPMWERRLCLSFACVLDQYHVRPQTGRSGGWFVAPSPTGRLLVELSESPFCPRCGGDLVPTSH